MVLIITAPVVQHRTSSLARWDCVRCAALGKGGNTVNVESPQVCQLRDSREREQPRPKNKTPYCAVFVGNNNGGAGLGEEGFQLVRENVRLAGDRRWDEDVLRILKSLA